MHPRVADVLPHDGSMVLLTRILRHMDDRTSCMVEITSTSPFCEPDGGVPAWVGIEYMAQCVAAHGGLRARATGQPIKAGFLLGARSVELYTGEFYPGQTLEVEVTHVWGQRDFFSFACSVKDAETGSALMEGHLTVLRGDTLKSFPGQRPRVSS